jgi:hypothetical protein
LAKTVIQANPQVIGESNDTVKTKGDLNKIVSPLCISWKFYVAASTL